MGAGVTEVRTETWATLVSAHPKLADSCFNTLVVDTQGAELEILKSIESTRGSSIALRGLEQFKYILVEVSNREFYQGQTLQTSLETLVDKLTPALNKFALKSETGTVVEDLKIVCGKVDDLESEVEGV